MSYKQRRPIIVSEGGTGNTTLTIHSVLLGNSTTAITQLANGTTGQLLTAVTGLDPQWAAPAASSISITGDTGGALTGAAFTFAGGTTGLSFGGSGTTETLTFAGITANGGTVSLATDATASTINIGTGGGVKTSTFGSTNTTSATTVQSGSGALNITSTNGAQTHNSGTGVMGISTDASATTVNIATGGAVKTTTLGSTNSTSATTIQNGSGALAITSTNGTITMNSGTGILAIANDATAQTVNIATGGGAKLVTLGTTNGASSLALKTGTADFSLASATGTIMSALDTGEITYPLQCAFSANLSATTASDKTGDGTAYTVICDTELFDQNSDYDNTTGIFTAPVTGKYFFTCTISANNVTTLHTLMNVWIQTNANNFVGNYSNSFICSSGGIYAGTVTALTPLTAGNTVIFRIAVTGGAKTVGVFGVAGAFLFTTCSGYLVC